MLNSMAHGDFFADIEFRYGEEGELLRILDLDRFFIGEYTFPEMKKALPPGWEQGRDRTVRFEAAVARCQGGVRNVYFCVGESARLCWRKDERVNTQCVTALVRLRNAHICGSQKSQENLAEKGKPPEKFPVVFMCVVAQKYTF